MALAHLIAAAVMDCIANDERSAFFWKKLPTGSQERVLCLRAARAAPRKTG